MTSSPTVPRTGLPSGPTTSAAMPTFGPPNEATRMGVSGLHDRMPPLTSVPPL